MAKNENQLRIRHYQEKKSKYIDLVKEEEQHIASQESLVENATGQALEQHCERVKVTSSPEKLERAIMQLTERIREKEKE